MRTIREHGPLGAAECSPCRRYRYTLELRVDAGENASGPARAGPGTACFVMLNPSTATPRSLDPTARRCLGFARAWGFAGVTLVNLFALRAAKPPALRRDPDPVGPRNDDRVAAALAGAGLVVLAWGDGAPGLPIDARGDRVRALARDAGLIAHALGRTRAGRPRHPLYLPATTRPFPWSAKPLPRSRTPARAAP